MFGTRFAPLARGYCNMRRHRSYPRPYVPVRQFSGSHALCESLLIQIHGHGTGVAQTISIPDKPYKISTDLQTTLGGKDSAPSPAAYALASLGSCSQVTGALVAMDNHIILGEWHVTVRAVLPTAVLIQGRQGNPNWESVSLSVRVQTDIKGGNGDPKFKHFVAEIERRCPITQLFKLSGVAFTSEWVNESL